MTDARARIAKQITAALPLVEEGGDWYIDTPVFGKPRAINQIVNALIDAHIRIEQLEAAPAQGSAWVNAKETLPAKSGYYFVWSKSCRGPWVARFDVGGTHQWNYVDVGDPGDEDTLLPGETNEVTHWMPLPAPPSVPQASSEPCERQRLAELATDFFLEPDTNKRKDEYVKRLLAYWRFNMSFSDAGQASAPEGEKRP